MSCLVTQKSPILLISISNLLLHASIQVHNDIDNGHSNLRRNQHNDNPLQHLAMAMAKLILQHRQQISNDIQPLRQQADSLIDLQIAPYGLVDRLELRLDPEELGGVEHGSVQVDVDAQDEELADLHVYLLSGQRDGARQGDLRRDFLAGCDGVVYEFFEERGLFGMSATDRAHTARRM